MRSFVLFLLFLSGCAVTPPPATDLRTTYLVCGHTIRVDINHDGRTAVLRDTTGEEVVLKRADSNIGTRYEGNGASIVRSGDLYVYYTRDGLALNCEPLRR